MNDESFKSVDEGGNEGNHVFKIIIGVGIIVVLIIGLLFYFPSYEFGEGIIIGETINRLFTGLRSINDEQEVFLVYNENIKEETEGQDLGIQLDLKLNIIDIEREDINTPIITYEIIDAPVNGSEFVFMGVGYIPYEKIYLSSYKTITPIKNLHKNDLVTINWSVWNSNFFPDSVHYVRFVHYINKDLCYTDYVFELPEDTE